MCSFKLSDLDLTLIMLYIKKIFPFTFAFQFGRVWFSAFPWFVPLPTSEFVNSNLLCLLVNLTKGWSESQLLVSFFCIVFLFVFILLISTLNLIISRHLLLLNITPPCSRVSGMPLS